MFCKEILFCLPFTEKKWTITLINVRTSSHWNWLKLMYHISIEATTETCPKWHWPNLEFRKNCHLTLVPNPCVKISKRPLKTTSLISVIWTLIFSVFTAPIEIFPAQPLILQARILGSTKSAVKVWGWQHNAISPNVNIGGKEHTSRHDVAV